MIGQFSKNEKSQQAREKIKKEIPFLKIEKVMDIINLPSREQIARLDENIKEINKKIEALKLSQDNFIINKTEALVTKLYPKNIAAFNKPGTENGNNNGLVLELNIAS